MLAPGEGEIKRIARGKGNIFSFLLCRLLDDLLVSLALC